MQRLPGITASSCSKRFKVDSLKPCVTLKILSYDIHSPSAWRIPITILLLVTEDIFKPTYSTLQIPNSVGDKFLTEILKMRHILLIMKKKQRPR